MACGATAIYQLTRNALAITREGLTILRDDEPEWLLPKGGESESGSGMGEIGLVLPEVRSWTPQRLAVRLNELLAECRCK
jgi:hypothetical protein